MNRANRRAEIRWHRRRAKAMSRAAGCNCPAELVLDPIDKRPVWTERPDSDSRLYIIRHRETCPLRLHPPPGSPDYVVVSRPEPECSR
jgi:hypothetical protein